MAQLTRQVLNGKRAYVRFDHRVCINIVQLAEAGGSLPIRISDMSRVVHFEIHAGNVHRTKKFYERVFLSHLAKLRVDTPKIQRPLWTHGG